MKLPVTYWADLAGILDKIPQKELPTTADVRKCIGSINQIRKALPKEYIEAKNDIEERSTKIIRKFQDEIAKIPEEKKEEREALVETYNSKKLKPIQDEMAALYEKNKHEQLDIDLDGNYKSFIKEVWEKHIRPEYRVTSVMVEVADAFGI